MAATLAPKTAESCQGGCALSFTLNTKTHVATFYVDSNGLRGAKHVPASTISVETEDDGTFADVFECPLCGYAHTFGSASGMDDY